MQVRDKTPNIIAAIADLRSRRCLLTTAEVLGILPYTRPTLCGWVRNGTIIAFSMPDNSYLFDSDYLADWLEARATQKLKKTA